jgi:hypothetical protein
MIITMGEERMEAIQTSSSEFSGDLALIQFVKEQDLMMFSCAESPLEMRGK